MKFGPSFPQQDPFSALAATDAPRVSRERHRGFPPLCLLPGERQAPPSYSSKGRSSRTPPVGVPRAPPTPRPGSGRPDVSVWSSSGPPGPSAEDFRAPRSGGAGPPTPCRARRPRRPGPRDPSTRGAAGRAGGGPAARADPAAASPHPPAAPRRPLAPRRRRRHAQGVGRRPRRQQPPAPCAPARPRRPPRGPRARPPAPTPPRARARAPTPPPPHRLRRAGGRRAARAGGRRSMRRGRHGCYRHRRRQAGLQHFRPPPPASWRLKGDASLFASPAEDKPQRWDMGFS
ncbi:uncharacterized protein [Marmota flaviventris]|uniref:uncharacterized protein n=1 Tax=Marmota flaviventris TaxID=93162 RepID=UPI003A88259B